MLLRIKISRIILAASFLCLPLLSQAENTKPEYSPSRVVYDLSSPNPDVLENLLDRISMLQNVYNNNPFEASIVVVIHEGAIPLFVSASKINQMKSKLIKRLNKLMLRAKSLTMGEIIKFRVCETSAKIQGFSSVDMRKFTSMVLMADAEIIMLQNNGYAYMR